MAYLNSRPAMISASKTPWDFPVAKSEKRELHWALKVVDFTYIGLFESYIYIPRNS